MSASPVIADEIAIRAKTKVAVAAVNSKQQDHRIIELWLHGRSPHTQRAYRSDADSFLAFARKHLADVSLDDAQAFEAQLGSRKLASASRHRILSGVKSLFAFAHRVGYLKFDVTLPLRLPSTKDTINCRILEEAQVLRLVAAGISRRDRTILKLLYYAGLRVSEAVSLKWSDLRSRGVGGQVTVFGKGAKTRTVLVQEPLWGELLSLRGGRREETAVFESRNGGHLHSSQVLRIVKAAAKRVGIKAAATPHWLRHCHASHALDRGAPIHLVQQTLGHSSVATTSRYLHARPAESSSSFLRSDSKKGA